MTVAGQSYVDTEAGFLLNKDDLLDTNKQVWWNLIMKLYVYDIFVEHWPCFTKLWELGYYNFENTNLILPK